MNAQNRAEGIEPLVLQRRSGGAVFLTLNRPAQYNALSEEMLAALHGALESLAADFQGLKDVSKFAQRAVALRSGSMTDARRTGWVSCVRRFGPRPCVANQTPSRRC